jgi:hypothetical protein
MPDFALGRDIKTLIIVSTALSMLMNAMRRSKAELSEMCESACLRSSTAPEAQVACMRGVLMPNVGLDFSFDALLFTRDLKLSLCLLLCQGLYSSKHREKNL